nr:MAG TPA: N acetylmuramidase [Caudoviricetes sp.]
MTVKQIQCLLTYLGYSPGTIDGADGRNTQGAIRAFQADYGLTVDGIPGAATQKMLIGAIAGTAGKGGEAGKQRRAEDGDVLGRYPVLYP